MATDVPPGFAIHDGIGAHAQAYWDLKRREGDEVWGGFTLTKDELMAELSTPGFDPATMMCFAFRETDDGGRPLPTPEPVGWVEVRAFQSPPVRPWGFGWVAPEACGRGIGTALIRRAEAIAAGFVTRIPDDARLVLGVASRVAAAQTLFADLGYTHTRDSLVMEIVFDGAPQEPDWPAGISFRSLADGLPLRDLVAVRQESFADHRGAVDEPLERAVERWEHFVESFARVYDPRLMQVMYVDGEPAGLVSSWTEDEDDASFGYVQTLGVLPAYRRRGFGRMLLEHAFVQAWQIGKRGVALGVDGASLTGADRLYRSAGMHERHRIEVWEKELRAGREISRQE